MRYRTTGNAERQIPRPLVAVGTALTAGLVRGDDGTRRCAWGDQPAIYRAYHDHEWGRPVDDDRRLFEKVCLEGFQAGLSWLTVLNKRQNFRSAFSDFDFTRVARFGERDVQRLLGDGGIIRHRGKIEASINNARRAVELIDAEGSLAAYFWRYEPPPKARPKRITWAVLKEMPDTPESRALSKDLKKRGWRFVGPTTIYAFMQAIGLVNDHVEGCDARTSVEQARHHFQPPR